MNTIANILKNHPADLAKNWLGEMAAATRRDDLVSDRDIQEQTARFISLLQNAVTHGDGLDIGRPEYADVKEFLSDLSRSRAQQGFTPTETAMFVLSFKRPLFAALRKIYSNDPEKLAVESWSIGEAIDKLALFTTEIHQKTREEVIARQQMDMLELSTPVVKLWEGILALPLIGTLDSARTAIVMESLLQKIVETGSAVAIIDITGVPTVDTLVAQHLLKTVTAARLMGADCIISGIRPQIAQTIVHLGVELGDVITKSSLSDAFNVALKRRGLSVQRTNLDRQKQSEKQAAQPPKTQGME